MTGLVVGLGTALVLKWVKRRLSCDNDVRIVYVKEDSMNTTNINIAKLESSTETACNTVKKTLSNVLEVAYDFTVNTAAGVAANA